MDIFRIKTDNIRYRKRLVFVGSLTMIILLLVIGRQIGALFFLSKGGYLFSQVVNDQLLINKNSIICDLNPVNDHFQREKLEMAADYFWRSSIMNPNNQHLNLMLGRICCLMGNYNNASKYLSIYSLHRPDNPYGHIELGITYEKLNLIDLSKKEWEYSKVTAEDILKAGQHHQRGGKHQEAIAWYSRGLRSFPEDPRLWFNLGLTLQEENNWEGALSAYNHALSSISNEYEFKSDIYFQIGVIYQVSPQNNIDKALEYYTLALKNNSFSTVRLQAEVIYRIGEMNERIYGDSRKSMEWYLRAINLYPDHFWAKLRYGYAYYQNYKDLHFSVLQINQSISIWPDDISRKWAYIFLGDIYKDAGENQKALLAYNKAKDIDPEDRNIIENINMLLESSR